jgi:hypothetical protein
VLRNIFVKFVVIIASLFYAHSLVAEAPAPLYEQKIKAGLVYNLIKYTEWPKTSLNSPNQIKNTYNSPSLSICLFGDDPFDGYLAPLQGRTAQQAIISIIPVTKVSEVGSCSAIILHYSQRDQLSSLLEFLQGKSILTLSDMEKFSELGGMVELARQEEKIEVRINKNSLDAANLIIDERMLKLAKIVSQGEAK